MSGFRATLALIFAAVLAIFASAEAQAAAEVLESYANVRPDGSLDVSGRHVRLSGLYIPTDGNCQRSRQADGCGTYAAVALNFKIQTFVRCVVQRRDSPTEVEAYCSLPGRTPVDPRFDLGLYLVTEGLAFARPDAPAEYQYAQLRARARQLGLWADLLQIPR